MYLLGQALPWPLSSLAGYFDGAATGRREHVQADADTGLGARPAAGGKMTEQEAYQVLGIERGASVTEISRAHRSLMKKLHPDQGGTTYLAARVNEAKDVLLRRHR
jgi:DnaJ domain